MAENNNNPASAPASPAPAAGGQPNADPNQTPNPQSGPGAQTDGGDKQVTLSEKDLNALKRKAGRWDALHQGGTNKPQKVAVPQNGEVDPEIMESLQIRDQKITELSTKNVQLELKDKIRDILSKEEYNGLPGALKKAIINNPLGFIKPDSSRISEMVEDIVSYMDEELDNPNSGQQQKPAEPLKIPPTPPANSSGPANPTANPTEGTEGKTGSARSTAVLKNLLNGRGSK